jgi:hypothetical protein
MQHGIGVISELLADVVDVIVRPWLVGDPGGGLRFVPGHARDRLVIFSPRACAPGFSILRREQGRGRRREASAAVLKSA